MKRIISIVLIVACVCMLFSCNAVTPENFAEAMKNTSPSKVTISTTTTTAGLGTLNGKYSITYNSDDTATIKYDCELWASIPTDGSEISEDAKEKITGTVTRDSDGSYSDSAFVEDVEPALSLDVTKLTEYTISVDGKTLNATVSKDNTAAVFGVAYDFDVNLTVVKGANVIESVSLAYVEGSNEVSIKCIYD